MALAEAPIDVADRIRPGEDARAYCAERLAAGRDWTGAVEDLARVTAPDCTGAEQVGRLSWWVAFVAELDAVPPLGRLVLSSLAQEADWDVGPSTWDELAKSTRLSPAAFERLIGRLVAAGALRVVKGRLAVESPVRPGLVTIPANLAAVR